MGLPQNRKAKKVLEGAAVDWVAIKRKNSEMMHLVNNPGLWDPSQSHITNIIIVVIKLKERGEC
jgi:hypothetical protein